MTNPEGGNTATQARRALLASAVFYVLIAFEFFYMASPFAAYLYAVYGPGLDWLQSSTLTSWSIGFFLPHIVAETRSVVIDVHGIVGQVLFAGGLGGFAIGAFQIYRAKLRRADAVDAVQGGLYRYIRHPQYLALVVASIGMVLIWPRYLVLVLTVTVIFIYIALAKAEEGICLRRFPGYAAYMEGTGMFLPVRLPANLLLPADAGVMRRVVTWGLAYAVALGLALLVATGLRSLALDSLYAVSADGDVYVSVVEIRDEELAAVAELARTAPVAQAAIGGRGQLLNYVVPANMYISEIPMRLPEGETFGHAVPPDWDRTTYKVVFTEAILDRVGADVLRHAVNKTALLEVHVDLQAQEVIAAYPPPAEPFYDGRPVPVF